jgi:peptide/nickel transport system substrate-binding protein
MTADRIGVIDEWMGMLRAGQVNRRTFIGRMVMLGVSTTMIGSLLEACSSPTSTTGGGQPKRGGTLVIGYQVEIPQLEPHTSPGTSSVRFHQLIYNSLLKFDDNLAPVGDLVQDGWKVSADGLTYTFTLKPNLKFHNGDPVTSDDVKFTIERILDPKIAAIGKSFISSVASVDAPSPDTVVLHLSTPSAALPVYLAGYETVIISKKVAQSGDLSKIENAIGTGPFKVDKWVPDSYMTLARNPTFHEPGKPYLDGLRVNIIPNEDDLLAAFRANSLDLTWTDSATFAKKADAVSAVSVVRVPALAYNLFFVQTAVPPLDNPDVRTALSYALDRNALIQGASLGEGVLSGPIPPANKRWARPVTDWADYKPDPAKAKQMLAAAGFPNGFSFTMYTQTSNPSHAPAMAQIAQAQWAQIGVKVNIQLMEFAAWVQKWLKADISIVPANNSGAPDPDFYLYRYFHSTGNLQFISGNFHTSELDGLLDKGRQSSDYATRKAAYDRAQEILVTGHPFYWTYSGYLYTLQSKRMHGFTALANDSIQNVRNIWLS